MPKISAGSYDLNKWLHGGYETDIATVLYGGPGSGKTNFALTCAVSQAKKGNKVIYVDTEGGFSVERVKQLAKGNGNAKEKEEISVDEVLKNILLLKPTNFEEQKKDFEKLLKYLSNDIALIVVDSITILYRLEFAVAREKNEAEIQKINSELVRQIKTLAEIARKREIPVLVTNQVYKWDDNTQMVGGDILKYWGKCLIEIENDRGKRTAYLRKHRSLAESSLTFQIYDGGIRKRGWI